MLKNDFIEITNRNSRARVYSSKCKLKRIKKEHMKADILFFIISIILMIIFASSFFKITAHASGLTDQDKINICYIARVVQAESGNQSDLGKKLVADTILNRMDSSDFPNNVKDVLEQDNQYATGIMADEDTIRLVMAEYIDRTNSEVLHFRTGYYHKWAVDMFQVGEHYFSK